MYDRLQLNESQLRTEYRECFRQISKLEERLPLTGGHSQSSKPKKKIKKAVEPQEQVEPPERAARKDVL